MSQPTYENKVLTGDKLVTLVSLIKTALDDKLSSIDLETELLSGLLTWYEPDDTQQVKPKTGRNIPEAVRGIIEAYFRKEIGNALQIEDDPVNNPGELWYPEGLIQALRSLIEEMIPSELGYPDDTLGDAIEKLMVDRLGGTPGTDSLSDAIDDRMPDVSGFQTASDVSTAIASAVSGFQTASQVQTAISSAVSGFQTASDVSSAISTATANFQTASDVQSAITSAISGITSFGFQIVSTLPVSNISETTIYLVLKSSGASGNIYTEYAWVKTGTDSTTGEDVYGWETLGDTAVTIETLSTAEVTNIWNSTSGL